VTHGLLPAAELAGPLRIGSLCTGYGGDLAVMAVLGARLAWCAETDRHTVGGRPDLTVCAESRVDAAGPGRAAARTCLLVRYPAMAEVGGRSAPRAAARDPYCACHQPASSLIAPPGGPGARRRPW
jgi:hypothetical protein